MLLSPSLIQLLTTQSAAPRCSTARTATGSGSTYLIVVSEARLYLIISYSHGIEREEGDDWDILIKLAQDDIAIDRKELYGNFAAVLRGFKIKIDEKTRPYAASPLQLLI